MKGSYVITKTVLNSVKDEYKNYIRDIVCRCGLRFQEWDSFEEHVTEELKNE